jgi:hypothetical protein
MRRVAGVASRLGRTQEAATTSSAARTAFLPPPLINRLQRNVA